MSLVVIFYQTAKPAALTFVKICTLHCGIIRKLQFYLTINVLGAGNLLLLYHRRSQFSFEANKLDNMLSNFQIDGGKSIFNRSVFTWINTLTFALQSSLNAEQGMGVASLSVIYASIIISSMFLPPIMIKNLGCKWTIVAGMACYVSYSFGNLYPGW